MHTHLTRKSRSTRQRGFSLLEVLIAVLILSFGLMGVAGLQVRSLQGTQSSNFRSNAAVLTQEIIDAMRANRSRAQDYAISMGSEIPEGSRIADIDLGNWRRRIAQQLPQGESEIRVQRTATAVPPNPSGAPQPASLSVRVTVTIRWQDARWLGTGTDGQTIVTTTTGI